MIKNYLKIAWRNLMKDKTFTLINVIGLSVAFGVAILLSMAAFYDLSYNSIHENGDRIYQTYVTQQTPKGPEAGTSQAAPFAEALQSEVPGIDKITRFLEQEALTTYKDKEINLDAVWVDSDFFEMFTFPALKGIENNPLHDKKSVVVSENTANMLFGSTEAVGQIVNILIDNKEVPFTVASIVADNNAQNTLEFDMAIPFENHAGYAESMETWNSQYHQVYLKLQDGVSPQQFEQNTRSFVELHYQEGIDNLKRDGAVADVDGLFLQLKLLPLKDVHFTSFRKGYAQVSRVVPYLILGVAFLILFIACVNFINMSIAKSAQRLKEIGMRKTLGARQKQLFFQFWSESLFVFIASVSIGILLSVLFIDDFKTVFRTNISLEIMTSSKVILGFLVMVLLITLVVGGYPALLLSRLGTIQSLKGKLETSGSNRVRNILMVVQFGIAILLISGTLVLWSQVFFMRNMDLGFNKEQVLSFPIDGKKNSYEAIQLLRNELAGNPNILSVTAADNNLGRGKDGSQFTSVWGFDYQGRGVRTNAVTVDYDYLETLGLELIQGRSFDKNYPGDVQAVIINESMAKELGEADPLSAFLPMSDSLRSPIIGVVKDYNFQDISRAIEPLTFFLDRNSGLYYGFVKISSENMAKSFNDVERAWKKIEPQADFLGSFLDENVDRTFGREKRMATMITSGSVIAIALSCIGLFAMSMLIVAQRTKEIGVRKVLGASVTSVTVLLTKDFLKLVFISFLIASPIAWWFMKVWLENYAFKINLTVWFFAAAGILAMVIAIFTVGSKTVKAALQNPVKSLRTE
ncbi:ABC-type antimicrobial peptide transport system permease subunit [Saonia flava]|uniref:ABC-type antimicrobial peptide transport system permease subunit n=1 Tax=Saonia flava TaxID=523696 RepID=A0A846QMJ3_9FLAO|nr:FtsX-like permease family protein [Saonia flava]NJB70216.1 ABC-type antimicrobial peptide transport system permease subunit [Saonia flava]